MIDLNTYPNRDEVRHLLATCMWPDEERVRRELERYRTDSSKNLLGKLENNELVGLIGVQRSEEEIEVILLHIAVNEAYWGKGIGKEMIHEYIAANEIKRMEAETDQDAVDFYRQIGFEICSLGEKYPGRERFRCILER
ncbi:GNAT family N-acetyltransferase [Paenibacillus segetis]|uniref:N-acetyltransferase n=1 Tax=Paenibacillus segetis TaxID=1325360 RepID=A0ABQ1YJ31_9BACL|nr:GNAT family N-acetyltransferase [Paenibacillus segetis]GGH27813.1 N-acetyltransferase [Paenibacillus segetis]